MNTFSAAQRYFLYRDPADMRKGFNGLGGLVLSGLKRDPLSGDVFVFVNRRRKLSATGQLNRRPMVAIRRTRRRQGIASAKQNHSTFRNDWVLAAIGDRR